MGNLKDIYDATGTKLAALTSLTCKKAWPAWDRPDQSPPALVLLFNRSAPVGVGVSRRYATWQAEYSAVMFATNEIQLLGYIDTLQDGLTDWGVQDGIMLTSGAVTGLEIGTFERYQPADTDPIDKVAFGVVVPLTFEFAR